MSLSVTTDSDAAHAHFVARWRLPWFVRVRRRANSASIVKSGKPVERRGRKASGLPATRPTIAGLPHGQGCQARICRPRLRGLCIVSGGRRIRDGGRCRNDADLQMETMAMGLHDHDATAAFERRAVDFRHAADVRPCRSELFVYACCIRSERQHADFHDRQSPHLGVIQRIHGPADRDAGVISGRPVRRHSHRRQRWPGTGFPGAIQHHGHAGQSHADDLGFSADFSA